MTEFLRFNESYESFEQRCTNETVFDCTEEEMLWWMIGPRRLSLTVLTPVTVVLLLIFATGVAGNVAVCVVIVRHPAMHTATNYYLFSLALSDLLLLLFGLPNDLLVCWHQYPYFLGIVFCKLRALISEAASYVSVLTIVAFSLERYLAICHPLHLYTMAGLRRALRIVAAIWALAMVAAVPVATYTSIHYLDYPPGSGNLSRESAFCAMLTMPSWYLCELSSLLFFILPAFIILGLYVRMGLRIRSSCSNSGSPGTLNGVNGSVHGEARQAQSRKTIIRMLAAVVVAFFVCWAPFHFQRLFYIYGRATPHFSTINEYLFFVAGGLYYVSATVNPILYNLMSHRYRIAFKETLCFGRARRKSKYYREHSSVRETTVNHTSDGSHLVRVRSQSGDRRNRISHKVFRRSSFTETSSTDRWKVNYFKTKDSCLLNSADSSPYNSKETRQLVNDVKKNSDVSF
ncbi:neuropeptides capa receptor-like [Cydia strobilella]|uniref:neuropeptides capa receptor-like n=1 Tax=Cydia strobilella TaxID=1100964 RepID=UPI003004E497